MFLQQRWNWRFLTFGSFLLMVFVVLLVRLADVQLAKGETYLQKAENNRFFTVLVPADRGVFLDRFGDPLVWNIAKYFRVDRPTSLFEKQMPITRDEALATMASTASASVITDTQRQYRFPLATAHVLGYVGTVTADDLQHDGTLHVDQQVGKAGLEKIAELQLRGQDGKQVFEINALGLKQRLIQEVPPIIGHNITTTIDPYLSEIVRQAMGNLQGAVVITDARTGDVLSLVSTPSFDPNVLSQTFADPAQEDARRSAVQALFSDPHNLFFDRAIAGAYPPGSIFKTVTALAGLESGKVDTNTQVVDDGKLTLGAYEFGNWYYSEYGRVEGAINIIQAITRSNDIFFYKAAEWAGPDAIAATAREFGLGTATGVGLPGESGGLVPDPAWKLQARNEKWFLGDTYHYGIGQGDLLTTPIQIAQLTQALANRGTLCQVHVLKSDQANCRDTGVKSENLNTVLQGMIGACSPKGTGFPLFAENAAHLAGLPSNTPIDAQIDDGVIACKTGTAEFGASDGRGYKKTHGWFTMMVGLPDVASASGTLTATSSAMTASSSAQLSAPTDPAILHTLWQRGIQKTGFPRRITITVLVESDDQNLFRQGSQDGAPVAKKIVDWVRDGVLGK